MEERDQDQPSNPPADITIVIVWFLEFFGGPWFWPIFVLCAVIALAMSC